MEAVHNIILACLLKLPFGRQFALGYAQSVVERYRPKKLSRVSLAVHVVVERQLRVKTYDEADELVGELLRQDEIHSEAGYVVRDRILTGYIERYASMYATHGREVPPVLVQVFNDIAERYQVEFSQSPNQMSGSTLASSAGRLRKEGIGKFDENDWP